MTEALDTGKAERVRLVKKTVASTVIIGAALGLRASAEDIKPNLDSDFTIVAMGDSILSGTTEESSRLFFDCQSNQISSVDIAAMNMGVKAMTAACYGSSIADMDKGRFGQPPQYDILNEETDLVLLSVGANAANLSELSQICLEGSCEHDDPIIGKALNDISSDELKEEMKQSHQKITERAPNAHIIQYQYYEMVKEDSLCGLALNALVGKNISGLADRYITGLNSTIQGAVDESKAAGIPIDTLPPTENMSPCDSGLTTLYLSLSSENSRAFGHPTPEGHRRIAKNLQRRLAGLSIDWAREQGDNILAASVREK